MYLRSLNSAAHLATSVPSLQERPSPGPQRGEFVPPPEPVGPLQPATRSPTKPRLTQREGRVHGLELLYEGCTRVLVAKGGQEANRLGTWVTRAVLPTDIPGASWALNVTCCQSRPRRQHGHPGDPADVLPTGIPTYDGRRDGTGQRGVATTTCPYPGTQAEGHCWSRRRLLYSCAVHSEPSTNLPAREKSLTSSSPAADGACFEQRNSRRGRTAELKVLELRRRGRVVSAARSPCAE
jgi:hypothetical protein